MIRRQLMLFLMAAGAVAVPYGISNRDKLLRGENPVAPLLSGGGATASPAAAASAATARTPPISAGDFPLEAAPLAGQPFGGAAPLQPPLYDLPQVLRFDVNPRWVTDRWPRVSTILSDVDLHGMRVPLVTGTQIDDVVGSLTYYFDKQGQVQRITLDGFTGDDRKLVALVTQVYGLLPEPSLGGGMYLSKWNGRPTSVLRVRHAPVVRSDAPHQRLEILLELNRPAARFGLSQRAHEVLQHDRRTQQW